MSEEKQKMKPVIVLARDEMHHDHVKMLRDNGYCVVSAKNPQSVKFMPQPVDFFAHERACIRLCRIMMSAQNANVTWYQKDINSWFAKLIIEGTSIDQNVTDEIEKAKLHERNIALQEARREEREKIKAEKAAKAEAGQGRKSISGEQNQ